LHEKVTQINVYQLGQELANGQDGNKEGAKRWERESREDGFG